jgi:hypothetical protein
MSSMICRPCITLRNGRKLCAHEVGRKAFCFEVQEEKDDNVKTPSQFSQQEDEVDTKGEKV